MDFIIDALIKKHVAEAKHARLVFICKDVLENKEIQNFVITSQPVIDKTTQVLNLEMGLSIENKGNNIKNYLNNI